LISCGYYMSSEDFILQYYFILALILLHESKSVLISEYQEKIFQKNSHEKREMDILVQL
jgi:hypothetical protein